MVASGNCGVNTVFGLFLHLVKKLVKKLKNFENKLDLASSSFPCSGRALSNAAMACITCASNSLINFCICLDCCGCKSENPGILDSFVENSLVHSIIFSIKSVRNWYSLRRDNTLILDITTSNKEANL